jgi:hypothetical protein
MLAFVTGLCLARAFGGGQGWAPRLLVLTPLAASCGSVVGLLAGFTTGTTSAPATGCALS